MTTLQAPVDVSLATPGPKQEENIDIVAITMAALRFVNPWSVDSTKRQWSQRIEPGSPEAKNRIISLAEVSYHDTPQDCWVVIYDRVYDITTFLEEVS